MTDRTKHLIETTARENEILDELPNLEKYGILPNTKTEVFRRGLHVVKHLAQSNEKALLRLLVEKLESASLTLGKKDIEEIKSLADAVYSIFIAKHGILGAEKFESVPIACRYLDLIEKQQVDKKEAGEMLEDIATSIRTLILKESKVMGVMDLKSYYAAMAMAAPGLLDTASSGKSDELIAE